MEMLGAALPWFTLGPWTIGPLTIQGFGLMVATGVISAYQLLSWRALKAGLDVDDIQSFTLHMLIVGFIGSHVIDLILYHPGRLLANPLILFKFGSTLSSFGGIVGAIGGAVLWKYRNPTKDIWPFLDVAAFSLPIGWFFGRVGCAVVHDHPGAPSDFFLAVTWPDGVARHDLGLYEAVWWLFVIALFWIIDLSRKDNLFFRRPGFFLALLPLVYTPIRFSLDFMRLQDASGGDARYFGLTPGQFFAATFFLIGAYLMFRWSKGTDYVREDLPLGGLRSEIPILAPAGNDAQKPGPDKDKPSGRQRKKTRTPKN